MEDLVGRVIQAHPSQKQDYKGGKTKLLVFFVTATLAVKSLIVTEGITSVIVIFWLAISYYPIVSGV